MASFLMLEVHFVTDACLITLHGPCSCVCTSMNHLHYIANLGALIYGTLLSLMVAYCGFIWSLVCLHWFRVSHTLLSTTSSSTCQLVLLALFLILPVIGNLPSIVLWMIYYSFFKCSINCSAYLFTFQYACLLAGIFCSTADKSSSSSTSILWS